MSQFKLLVFTGTRADYGLLYWLLKDAQADTRVDLQLLVSGAHLSARHGNTYTLIENDGFVISRKVDMLLGGDSPRSIAKSVGLATLGYADALDDLQPDAILVLGDRYEAFAIAQVAYLMQIPVIHLHGGEITEGANDDGLRHAISKFSSLHFTSTESHRRRVIQLGEPPESVVHSGAPGLEHLRRSTLPTLHQLSADVSFDLTRPYFLVAYHPVTTRDDGGTQELTELLQALERFEGYQLVVSATNADVRSSDISRLLEEFSQRQGGRVLMSSSFGHLNFLALLKNAALMIGNSSSGVVEAPSFNTPSIDIGTRQQGRDRARSVVSASGSNEDISAKITAVLHDVISADSFINPYDNGNCSQQIIDRLLADQLTSIKSFHDINVEI